MEVDSENKTYVLVDCNNMPKAFQTACELASPTVIVEGFAGPEYNGYVPQYTQHAKLTRAKHRLKDMTKVVIVIHAVRTVFEAQSAKTVRFIIVTKDKGGQAIEQGLKDVNIIAKLINTDGEDLATLLQNL